MGNSLAYQERRGGHSTNSARSDLPGLARAIRTCHQAKLHERSRVGERLEVQVPYLPLKAWPVNKGCVIAANIAADLTAWTRLPGRHDLAT